MKTLYLFICLMVSLPTFARVDTTALSSNIEDVTVFLSGAEITRHAKLQLNAGKYILTLKDLPAEINSQSIQVGTVPGARILSVKHELHYPRIDRHNKDRQELERQIEEKERHFKRLQDELEVYQIEEDLLMENRQLSNRRESLTIAELRGAADFFRTRINEIRRLRLDLKLEQNETETDRQKLQRRLDRLTPAQQVAKSRLLIGISCDQNVSGNISVSYFVPTAAWTPLYDFRVESTEEPLVVVYNAHVYQSTGEDWKGVNLVLSNANPTLSGTKPELKTWYLDRKPQSSASHARAPESMSNPTGHGGLQGRLYDAETDEPLPFVNVVLLQNGSQITGVSTDMDGRYRIKPISPGIYDIHITSVGYQKVKIEGVVINVNKFTFQDVALDPSSIQMEEFEVIAYNAPMIVKDGGPSGGTVVRSSISRMPGRGARDVASYTGGVGSVDTYYYIDGVKVRRDTPLNESFFDAASTYKVGNVEYTIDLPYTILSDGRDNLIKIQEIEQPVEYVYHAVPKLESEVFLTARLPNRAELNLLSGPSSIYYQGTFTGESMIDAQQMTDTLIISLARERNIVVVRKGVKDLYDRRFIGSNVKETIAWQIEVRNNLNRKVTIVVEDQFPKSERQSISVDLHDNTATSVDHQRGELLWKFELEANAQHKLQHGYNLKFPTGTRIYNE